MTTYKTRNAEKVQSWEEVAETADRLERLARRFGLLQEFRENGLI